MKRVVLVHGWESGPGKDWFPWLSAQLQNRGYEIITPQLPHPEDPRKERWVPALAAAVGTADSETYFIAHSMGCQAVLRYLETLPEGLLVGGALFVAGFLKPLTNLEGPTEEEIASSWTDAPLNLLKVRMHLPKCIAIFSDNDEWVSLENIEAFREGLGSQVSTLHARGHITGTEEPAILSAALELVS